MAAVDHQPAPFGTPVPALSAALAQCLRTMKVSSDRIACLDIAMLNSVVDPAARATAKGFDMAFHNGQMMGLADQLTRLLQSLNKWKGAEAVAVKKVLKRWAEEIIMSR